MKVFCCGVLMMLIAGCQPTPKEFLGPTAVRVLEQPTKLQGWRIRGKAGGPFESEPAKDLDIALARPLAQVMFDPKTYDFNSAKGCMFQPGVGFRVWRDQQSIDIIFCFHCNELKVVSSDPIPKKFPQRMEDFDRARPALVRLVKQAFAGDGEIQNLKSSD